MSKRFKAPSPLGATGRFPRGKVHASDEGEIRLGIAADPKHHVVVLDFGTPVKWFALPPAHARQLAAMLIHHAEKLESGPPPSLPS